MSLKPRPRTILEPLAESALDSDSSSIKSLVFSKLPDSRTVFYVGTVSGVLLLYSLQVSPNEIALVKRSSLPRSGGGAGFEKLNSIHPLVHIGKIVVVSEGFLFLVDSGLLEPPKRISLFKGVTAFSRKLGSRRHDSSVYSNGNGALNNSVNITRSNAGTSNLAAVGIGKKLVLAELILSGSLVIQKEISGIVDGTILSLLWVDDSVFIGTKVGYYLYNCTSGRSGLIFQLPDSSGLPRMKFLVKESAALLMVDNVGVIVDMEGQPMGGSLVFKEAPDSFAEVGGYVVVARKSTIELYHKKTGLCAQTLIVGDRGPSVLADGENESAKLVTAATNSKLICYGKVSEEEQIKDLLRKQSFKEAISLVEELENEGEMTKDMLSFVHAQVGFLLLFDLHFKEAVDHFLLSESMQPSELFPFILRDPNCWTLLVPRNRYWGLHPPPTHLENLIDDGLKAIQRAAFLKKAGVETVVDDEFLLNPPSKADLLESAIENMIRYLQSCREKDLALSVREGVDTLLMQLYGALNRVNDMERLASFENSCVVEELEALLNDSGHLRTLAFLCAGKGMSAKALSIWRILAKDFSSNNYHHKDWSKENNSQDSSSKFNCGRETAAREACKILEESSDQDLVLQHLGWIADVSQVLAVQILISDKRNSLLSPDEVIAAVDPQKVEILQRYLQWLIEDQGSDDSQFHTAYALLLAKSALETYQMKLSAQGSMIGMSQNDTKVSELEMSMIFDTPVRERLQIFLQSSDLYDAEEVLDMIEESELWLEKAILYRRLGQEILVLQILAWKLENCEAAEQYCAEIGRPDAYMQLLEMYLNPEDGREPMYKAAVHLFHNHGQLLDSLQVLERLSPDMPLQLASNTLLRMLRAQHHHYRQGQIVHNLSRALDVDASLARLEERSRHVQINEESLCHSCHARLGTKLFAMHPDDTIVCYKCYRRQGESTSASRQDFKKEMVVKPGWLVTR